MADPAFIEVNQIRKSYYSKGTAQEILKGISLSIAKRSITGILGRSGAGKSTLMRCLNLLDRPDSGQIIFDQEEIPYQNALEMKRFRRRIGIVPQSLDLLNNRSVRKNIALPLEILGLPKPEIQSRVERCTSWVGLQDKLEAFPSQLSGGQKQRVAIARALITEPALLLCDEFTSALDPETTHETLSLIRTLRDLTGTTLILITHDRSVAAEICDYLYVLEEGAVIHQGEKEAVLARLAEASARRARSEEKPHG